MKRFVGDLFPDRKLSPPDAREAAVRDTHLGMAHIAGTGPRGATCRQCSYFGKQQYDAETGEPAGVAHARYSLKRKDGKAGDIKPHRCLYPVVGKANRLVPHSASACRLFERNPDPPRILVLKEDPQKTKSKK